MDERRTRFRSLTFKVDLILVVALAIGVGAALGAFALYSVYSLEQQTKRNLNQQANLLYASIENFMLPGEAPIAVRFFGQVELTSPEYRIALYRRDGDRAFSDNSTIERVNSNLKVQKFKPRSAEAPAIPTLSKPRFFEAAGKPPRELIFRDDEGAVLLGGRAFFRAYRPLVNLPKCTVCHGSDHTVRGVIDIRNDVTSLAREQQSAIGAAGGAFLLIVALLAFVIGAFLRRVVLEPVQAIGRLCSEVAGGNFEGRVESSGGDEIGELARTVNGMVEGLYERYQLTKYVSAGTIGSLRAGQEPRRVRRSLLFTDVRGFTSYTERHGPEEVVAVLNRILEAQAGIIQAEGGDIDKFVGDEVVAVFSGDDSALRACRAAAAILRLGAERALDFDGLELGLGIATGSVIQGMVGSSLRADFTVIGDSVNVASRLCSLARGGQALVCAATREAAASGFSFRGPVAARLKGKLDAQRVWSLASERQDRGASAAAPLPATAPERSPAGTGKRARE